MVASRLHFNGGAVVKFVPAVVGFPVNELDEGH
jgi:hypothetical protein